MAASRVRLEVEHVLGFLVQPLGVSVDHLEVTPFSRAARMARETLLNQLRGSFTTSFPSGKEISPPYSTRSSGSSGFELWELSPAGRGGR
jgi:hypothetical protein